MTSCPKRKTLSAWCRERRKNWIKVQPYFGILLDNPTFEHYWEVYCNTPLDHRDSEPRLGKIIPIPSDKRSKWRHRMVDTMFEADQLLRSVRFAKEFFREHIENYDDFVNYYMQSHYNRRMIEPDYSYSDGLTSYQHVDRLNPSKLNPGVYNTEVDYFENTFKEYRSLLDSQQRLQKLQSVLSDYSQRKLNQQSSLFSMKQPSTSFASTVTGQRTNEATVTDINNTVGGSGKHTGIINDDIWNERVTKAAAKRATRRLKQSDKNEPQQFNSNPNDSDSDDSETEIPSSSHGHHYEHGRPHHRQRSFKEKMQAWHHNYETRPRNPDNTYHVGEMNETDYYHKVMKPTTSTQQSNPQESNPNKFEPMFFRDDDYPYKLHNNAHDEDEFCRTLSRQDRERYNRMELANVEYGEFSAFDLFREKVRPEKSLLQTINHEDLLEVEYMPEMTLDDIRDKMPSLSRELAEEVYTSYLKQEISERTTQQQPIYSYMRKLVPFIEDTKVKFAYLRHYDAQTEPRLVERSCQTNPVCEKKRVQQLKSLVIASRSHAPDE